MMLQLNRYHNNLTIDYNAIFASVFYIKTYIQSFYDVFLTFIMNIDPKDPLFSKILLIRERAKRCIIYHINMFDLSCHSNAVFILHYPGYKLTLLQSL